MIPSPLHPTELEVFVASLRNAPASPVQADLELGLWSHQ